MFAAQALSNDLVYIKTMEGNAKGTLPHNFQKMVKLPLNKIKAHTRYLSKRLVSLGFLILQ